MQSEGNDDEYGEEDDYYDEEQPDAKDDHEGSNSTDLDRDDQNTVTESEDDEPEWLKEELIASRQRARWGQSSAHLEVKAPVEEKIEEDI